MIVRDVALPELEAALVASSAYIDPTGDVRSRYAEPGVLVKGCVGERGAVMLIPFPNDTFEIHYFDACARVVAAVVDWAFENTAVAVLFGPCPVDHAPARVVNTWLGGVVVGEMAAHNGQLCKVYALSREARLARRKPASV